jgi:DNA-binding NarL/FixJ family response regulator
MARLVIGALWLVNMPAASDGLLNARIIVADDFEMIRRGLRGLLGDAVCGEAADGEEAIKKVLALRPDLVFLDLSMPVKDGLHAAKEIRRLAPATKIVIFTMHAWPGLRNEVIAAGADAYLHKSSESDEILQTVRSLVAPLPHGLPHGTVGMSKAGA